MSKVYSFGGGLCECGQEFCIAYVYLDEEDRKSSVGIHANFPDEVQLVDVVKYGEEFVCRSCLKPYRLPTVETVEKDPQTLDEWGDENLNRIEYKTELENIKQVLRRQFNKLIRSRSRADTAVFSENLERFSELLNEKVYNDFFWADVKVIVRIDPEIAERFYELGRAARKSRGRKQS